MQRDLMRLKSSWQQMLVRENVWLLCLLFASVCLFIYLFICFVLFCFVFIYLTFLTAESSITLPDVDLVLCLGTHKALQYHSSTHRVHLVNTWISKASATQRAGRTGRVRPGRVFRLYTKALHESLREHEESEIQRLVDADE
jgi:hypothetical protein